MTIANVDLFEILIKRGDAISSAAYVGPLGEPLYDTGLQTLRIQDGVTPGGQILATANQVTAIASNVANLQATVSSIGNLDVGLSSNVSVLQSNISMLSSQIANIVSNVGVVQASVYGDANVAAYLPTDNTIINIRSGITGANAAIITANSAVVSYVNAQTGVLQSEITAANAATIAANAAVVSYVNAQDGLLQAGINAANAAIITANSAVVSYVDTQINSLINGAPDTLNTLNLIAANLAADANGIITILNAVNGANNAIITANTAVVGYVNDQVNAINGQRLQSIANFNSSLQALNANLGVAVTNIAGLISNVAINDSEISELMAEVASLNYGNTNVAAYLPGYTGSLDRSSTIQSLTSDVSALQSNSGNLAYSISETISTVEVHTENIQTLETLINVRPESFTVLGNLTSANVYANVYFWANSRSDTGYSPLALVATTNNYLDLDNTPVLADVAISGDYNDLKNKPLSGNIGNGGNYGNIEVLSYLSSNTDPTIRNLNANAAIQQAQINSIDSNIGAFETYANLNFTHANTSINSTNSNLGAYVTYANANIGALYLGNISTQANLGAYQIYANANAATQSTQIVNVQANLTSFGTYANTTFGISNYSNANVAAYLPTDPTVVAMSANIVTVQNLQSNISSPPITMYNITSNAGPITTNTYNLIYNNKNVDTNNFYNTSNGIFQPNIAGYYQILATFFPNIVSPGTAFTDGTNFILALYKNNGAQPVAIGPFIELQYAGVSPSPINTIVSFNGTTDFVQVKLIAYVPGTATIYTGSALAEYFQAIWLRGI
jgi:hypothetical protein